MVVTLVEVVEQNSGWMEWMEVDEVGVGEVGVVESISSCRQDSI